MPVAVSVSTCLMLMHEYILDFVFKNGEAVVAFGNGAELNASQEENVCLKENMFVVTEVEEEHDCIASVFSLKLAGSALPFPLHLRLPPSVPKDLVDQLDVCRHSGDPEQPSVGGKGDEALDKDLDEGCETLAGGAFSIGYAEIRLPDLCTDIVIGISEEVVYKSKCVDQSVVEPAASTSRSLRNRKPVLPPRRSLSGL
eukprot:2831843-Pleurochrysis_carterae.AAC.2